MTDDREYELVSWTPEQFKAAREELGLTVRDLAHVINVHPDTVRKKWEKAGSYGPHPTAVAAMMWFQTGFRPPEWPEHLLEKERGAE